MSAPLARVDSPAANSGTSTPKTAEASGYLLLTIQHATVKQVHAGESGVLAQGEMSLPIPAAVGKQTANPFSPSPSDPAVPTHDFWLVLKIGVFEMPLIPTQPCTPQPKSAEGVGYSFASQTLPGASTVLSLPLPSSDADLEDLDSFEVLLRQYGTLGPEATALTDVSAVPLAAEDMRGKLVLINEDNGEVVGELDQTIDLVEDKRVGQGSQDRPVVLDFGTVVDGYSPVVKVQTVPEDEMDDWILKGAHYVSKGILGFSSFTSKTIQGGTDMFIRNTKATDKPVHFSPATKAGIRVTHNASVRTVKVAKSTLGKINDVVAEKTYHKTVEPAVGFYKDATDTRRQSLGAIIPGTKDGPPLPSFKNTAAPGTIGGPPLPSGVGFVAPLPPRSSRPSISTESGVSGAPPPPYPGTGPALPPRKSPVASPLSPSVPATVPVPGEKPPIPPKPASLQTPTDHRGEKLEIPSQVDTLLAQENALLSPTGTTPLAQSPASIGTAPSSQVTSPASAAPKKRPFLNRLLLAGEVVLTSLEATAHELINTGTSAASSAAEHKFGPEAGRATQLLGGSVRNVAVVYIDVRGVGRKALLQGTAKGFVKARLKSGETVQLQGGGQVAGGTEVATGEVERTETGTVVVGMPQVLPTGNESSVLAEQARTDSPANMSSPASAVAPSTAATGGAPGSQARPNPAQGKNSMVDEDTLKMLERM